MRKGPGPGAARTGGTTVYPSSAPPQRARKPSLGSLHSREHFQARAATSPAHGFPPQEATLSAQAVQQVLDNTGTDTAT